jgi:hypothetical protein
MTETNTDERGELIVDGRWAGDVGKTGASTGDGQACTLVVATGARFDHPVITFAGLVVSSRQARELAALLIKAADKLHAVERTQQLLGR